MNYIELSLQTDPQFVELFIAELAEIQYDAFEETADGVNAYIREDLFDQALLDQLIGKYRDQTAIAFFTQTLEKRNWNAEWEQNYPPIEVNDAVRVRASFHEPDPRFRFDLLINPKMSFGTGHHETTALVMQEQLRLDHQHAAIMDVGCGTGILAILAGKLGARSLTAFDIDEWAVANSKENLELNGITAEVVLFQGTVTDIADGTLFDGILANINRNILLEQLPVYSRHLKPGGWLVVSGFYQSDAAAISACGQTAGLTAVRQEVNNEWTSIVFTKTG